MLVSLASMVVNLGASFVLVNTGRNGTCGAGALDRRWWRCSARRRCSSCCAAALGGLETPRIASSALRVGDRVGGDGRRHARAAQG